MIKQAYLYINFMRKIFPDYFIITLKGMAIGAADVVPGVSGGTIAFISGIYEELIQSINGVNFSLLTTLKKEGFKVAWKQLNGGFLISLLIGIAISILSFAKLITHLLHEKPVLVWAFFFGLVLASIAVMWKEVSHWTLKNGVGLVIGAVIAYYITIMKPSTAMDSYFYLFLSGFIAIIAMILPGISGAFILLLMGSYKTVIGLLNSSREHLFDWNWELLYPILLKISTFLIGALLGIKIFSKILNWMFSKHKNLTFSLLIGFMIGSLNKLWPWKEVLETTTNSHGELVPLIEKNINPIHFDGEPQIALVSALCILGIFLILGLEKLAKYKIA